MYRVERMPRAVPKDSGGGNMHNIDAVSDALKRCHKRSAQPQESGAGAPNTDE